MLTRSETINAAEAKLVEQNAICQEAVNARRIVLDQTKEGCFKALNKYDKERITAMWKLEYPNLKATTKKNMMDDLAESIAQNESLVQSYTAKVESLRPHHLVEFALDQARDFNHSAINFIDALQSSSEQTFSAHNVERMTSVVVGQTEAEAWIDTLRLWVNGKGSFADCFTYTALYRMNHPGNSSGNGYRAHAHAVIEGNLRFQSRIKPEMLDRIT